MAITHDYVAWATGNDYKGATFTDGAFTVADMTLTKAGAFTASKANHWLYLTDNGSNEITDGYYRIASVTSANAVVLATSPKSGANDPTDVKCTQHDGTTALPWRSDQGAVDLLTRNTTDGNQVNISDAAAVVHTAALDLATFIAAGALSGAAPLVLRGCTATANDGGIGEIDCGGATMFAATTYDYIVLVDLEIHTFGDNHGVQLDDYNLIDHCEIHKGASSPATKRLISLDSNNVVINCYIHEPNTSGLSIYVSGVGNYIAGNYLDIANGDSAVGISTGNSQGSTIINNIVTCNDASAVGISIAGPWQHVVNNIIFNRAAGTGRGIHAGNFDGRYPGVVMNNIIVGWSGAGGAGIESEDDIYVLGHNAFYNNAANYDLVDQTFIDLTANDVALAADPFTDAANGDFSLTAAAETALASKGFPLAYLGAHANTVPNLNIGPIQMAAGSGGGVNMPRVRVGH